jgi:hypothetical protein
VNDARPSTARRGRAKLALSLLAAFSCVAGAAYALATSGRSPSSSASEARAAGVSAKKLSIRVDPSTRSIPHGATTEFTVQIRRRGRGRVRLSVLDGVPAGASASFTPSSTRKRRATLTLASADARSGGHRIRLLARSGARRAIAPLNLVINSTQPTNFTIAGNLPSQLRPGYSLAADLALTNPGSTEIAITALRLSLAAFTAPRATTAYPCSLDDFSVTQFSGSYGFTIPAGSTRRLSELGVPAAQWPHVAMLNRPLNQNGCKGATVAFAYGGSARGDE